MIARFFLQFFYKILSLFCVILSLYKFAKICYTAYMNIRTYFKEKRKEKQARKAYLKRLSETGLRFPVFCKVRCVKSFDHQGAIVQSRIGDKLQIVHTPSDERPFSVAVYSIPLNRVLGYIEEELAEKLVYLFGRDFCRDGEVEMITGGAPYKYYGCNIRLTDEQEFLNDTEDFSNLHGAY